MNIKRRINLIIGKKQIILAGLTLILAVAIYVNYVAGANLSTDEPTLSDSVSDSASYGDTQFVSDENNTVVSSEDVSSEDSSSDAFFAQARLDKAESRAEALEVLQSMYFGGDSTETELAVIAQSTVSISDYIESESKIENILKAQGFEDVLCYLSENGASIIVKTQGLDAAQAAQIKNALLSEVKISAENITIVEIK